MSGKGQRMICATGLRSAGGGPQFYNNHQNRDPGQSSNAPMRCFNCNKDGHHWSVCKNDPFCYSCRNTGHKSARCQMIKSKGLTLCAIGMPGQLFYSLNLPEAKSEDKKEDKARIRALISILEGRGTKAKVKTELQYLIDSEWNWDVRRISGSEFIVNIPSKNVMQILSKSGKMKFITSDILAVVEETKMDPEAF